MTIAAVCASDAFNQQLKSLCITDYPCGVGSWRQSSDRNQYCNSAQYETSEDLMNLERSSPYAVNYNWSKDTASLRKIAVHTPESLTDPNFVMKHFTTLRMITEVDEGMLKLVNLKELILSANFITDLDGQNLPRGLEVLELAANRITDLSGLKAGNFPRLLHLGLAHNQVPYLSSRSMTPAKWPSLLSVDLSYNNLNDLEITVGILKQLPMLRNLLLIGNPLYLSKCYHGFIIDSIPGLSYLDNTEVSADDKHHFKSFSKIKDIDVNTSHIVVEIAGINGVKKPAEAEEPDSLAEYPKIEFKYHVEFEILKESVVEEPAGSEQNLGLPNDTTLVPEDVFEPEDLQVVSTDKLPWAETIEYNFNKTFRSHELAELRDFLKNGLTFTVVGVKHSYVLEDPQLAEDVTAANKGSSLEKHCTKSASKDRSKDTKEKGKCAEGKEKNAKAGKDKGKKDKHDLSELFELPQIRKIVGSCHVPLASLLEGEASVKANSPCNEDTNPGGTGGENGNENLCEGSNKPQSAKRSDVSDKKKPKGDVDKHLKATPTRVKAKDRDKSAAQGAKGTKSGKGKDKAEEINDDGDDEVAPPPPPLSVSLEIKLDRWKKTKDALEDSKI